MLEDQLAEKILDGTIQSDSKVVCTMRKKELVFENKS
jgi:ATP-dependent Clp protease ATP-binding subunit ClpA